MKNKTKKNIKNQITIRVNFNSPDMGYKDLINNRLKKFLLENMLKGNNLIQTIPNKPFICFGKTEIHLQAISYQNWCKNVNWDEIECQEYSNWLKATPCNVGKNTKLFVKYMSNENIAGFGVYLLQLLSGEITLEKHKEFIQILKKIMKKNLITIHNEDIKWFHLKCIQS